jgi:hypothetical protein
MRGMEKKIAILFLNWICKNTSRIQDNIVEYGGKYYVTYGLPFDDVRSTEELYQAFVDS